MNFSANNLYMYLTNSTVFVYTLFYIYTMKKDWNEINVLSNLSNVTHVIISIGIGILMINARKDHIIRMLYVIGLFTSSNIN
jgi:hypothetical protein